MVDSSGSQVNRAQDAPGSDLETRLRRQQSTPQVFDDIPDALEAWQRAGLRLRIYSSGSILAQNLLFAQTEHGDVTPLFERYHDTTTGPKMEADSYRAIADAFDLPAGTILFLSDVPAELDAAAAAGMPTGLMVRPGNKPVANDCPHPVYRDFTELAVGL